VNFKVIFRTGDRLKILEGHQEYSTSIDDVMDESNFSILRPHEHGKSVTLEPGQQYCMMCVKSGGIHRFNAMVLRTETSGKVTVIYCRYTGDYIRLQRRNAYRCPMILDVQIRKKRSDRAAEEREWISAKTLNISETGMYARLDSTFTQGDLIECILSIDKYGISAILPVITGVIVRTSDLPNRSNEHMCGIRFGNIDEKSRNLLLKLVTLGQRKKMRQ
jgi:c-di-GMP-binding flagellar brake protein YcgR